MTLISVHNNEGCVGRCDSKCYNATGPVCTCCCGGLNHGKGLQQAMENTAERAQRLMEEWGEENPGENIQIGSMQEELFPEEEVAV